MRSFRPLMFPQQALKVKFATPVLVRVGRVCDRLSRYHNSRHGFTQRRKGGTNRQMSR